MRDRPSMRYTNNIRALKDAKGWTIDQAAAAMGLSRGGYIKVERGENRLTSTTLANAARAFGVTESDIVSKDDESATVQVLGLVGAGSAMLLYSEGDPPDDWVPAPDNSTEKTVALEIRGDSLGAMFNGWLLFYDDVRNPPDDLIGRMCVVGLADGRVLVKQLKNGGIPGVFSLHSNFEPPIYDVAVAWAAEVKDMRPRR